MADSSRVFLLGFSQASGANFRFAFTNGDLVRGVVAVCGGIPGDWETEGKYQSGVVDVLCVAGERDQYYTPDRMRRNAEALRRRARSVELRFFDTAFDEQQIKVGRRLAIKILNASKFALSLEGDQGEVADPLDRSMLRRLAETVAEATEAFEDYEHARAIELVERFFWGFTDDYLELVKSRAYGTHGPEAAGSAIASLRLALSVLLRAFAPFLPYVTEEVWSWWQEGSVHRSAWPSAAELEGPSAGGDPIVYEVAAGVLGEVRKAKALAKRSLRTEATRVVVRDTEERLKVLRGVERDVREAGNVAEIAYEEAAEPTVEVDLAPE